MTYLQYVTEIVARREIFLKNGLLFFLTQLVILAPFATCNNVCSTSGFSTKFEIIAYF